MKRPRLSLIPLMLTASAFFTACNNVPVAPQVTTEKTTDSVTTAYVTTAEPEQEVAPEYAGTHYTYADIVDRMLDTSYLASWGNGERSAEFTSYDRASKRVGSSFVNWSANGDGGQYISKTDDGGFLIAEMEGPGYISRIWSATAGTGHVKIYIDGVEEPVIDLPFEKFFNGTTYPFRYGSLVYNDAAQGKNSYVPITYNKSCRIVAYGDWGKYYHINYTTLNPKDTVESLTDADLTEEQRAALARVNSFFAKSVGTHPSGLADGEFREFSVSPSTPAVLSFDGKGAFSGILLRLDSVPACEHPNSENVITLLKTLRLKIWWDGEEKPSVDVPLGDFFASAYGLTDARTLLLGVRDDRTLYNYYYMPYFKGAKMEISSEGDLCADVSVAVTVAENTVPKYAALRFSSVFSLGEYTKDKSRWPDHLILKADGAGRLAGLTLHVSMWKDGPDPESAPGSPWWGEGDEKFFVDGESFPSWFGTGTEDFFGYAWCDPTPFNKAFHCQSYCTGRSVLKGNRCVTRLLMADSIPFNESLDAYLEKYYSDEYVRYGYTAYMYLAPDAGTDREHVAAGEILSNISLDSSAVTGGFIEGEDLFVQSVDAGGKTASQRVASFGQWWSGDTQLFCTGLGAGRGVTASLPAKADGEYMLVASFTKAPDYGKVKVSVNGIPVGAEVNTYGPAVIADELTELGRVSLKKGYENTVTFTVSGKDQKASNTFFGVDFLLLIPVESYAGLEGIDLSEYGLYRKNAKPAEAADFTVEGEALKVIASVSVGKTSVQSMKGFGSSWSGNAQMWWTGGNNNATLTVKIHALKAG
ncbi:MAG: DUF2961 domain-containing protein, partial [Clostridia bacterium]|nr:DUF2961 domain-containing protein [Clostridia bacterium]